MLSKLEKLKKETFEKIKKIEKEIDLSNLHISILGRKGELTKILRQLSSLTLEEKVKIGKFANSLKRELEEVFTEKEKELKTQALKNLQKDSIDITFPTPISIGHLHPITQVQSEIEDLFTSLGFMILDGPEIESDYYNFESLNFSPDHPARDTQDTFYLEGGNLLRTQTSSVQVRALEKYGAPLKAIVPGRTFRNEATDASHENTFYQVEGLMVDKNISIANLIGVMRNLIEEILHEKVKTRLRPGYFPFVEPGFEMDINCLLCKGKGCSSCKNSGWLEILPCGMVHPNVLKFGKVDPKQYSGFAFGLGLDRLTMMKYKINDIRLFHSADLRFLKQF
jgi:phenylalanyl-tRNA synthetase alpha chain